MARTSDFTEIFNAHWPRVCAYVARRTQAAVAEDVAAEVFAIAWRRRDELPRDVLPWLLRTASNLLRNQWRADARRARRDRRARVFLIDAHRELGTARIAVSAETYLPVYARMGLSTYVYDRVEVTGRPRGR